MIAAPQSSAVTEEDFEVLRELEVAWLTAHLSDAIANLGYPVGMGMAPHPDQVKRAANTLFERYGKMIKAARGMRDVAQRPTNRELHDAIAAAMAQQGLTYSGIQEAVRAIEKLYAAPQPASNAYAPGMQKALQNIEYVLRKDSLTDNERVESALIGVRRLLASSLSSTDREGT